MMCIVVNDGRSMEFALVLETTVSTTETMQSFCNLLPRKIHILTKRNAGKGIADIVQTRNGKGHARKILALVYRCKSGTTQFIISNVLWIIITGIGKAKGDDLAGKTFCDLLIVRDLTVDDQSTVCLGIACKLVERGTHICQIFEEIQMFCFYI